MRSSSCPVGEGAGFPAGKPGLAEGAGFAPDLPPLARVYPEAPSRETAEITFELTGGFVSAGETGVPVDLFITSSFEFSGYTVGVTFPPEYLSISSVEEHIRPGIKNIDNAAGHLVLAMLNGLQRVGAEGERVRIATLYLDVEDAAAEVDQLELRLEPAGSPPISNWVEIRHLGAESGDVPIATRVEPLTLDHALLNVLPEVVVFIRGEFVSCLGLRGVRRPHPVRPGGPLSSGSRPSRSARGSSSRVRRGPGSSRPSRRA